MYPKHEPASPLHAFVDAKRLERKGTPLSQLNCLPGSKDVVVAFDGNKVLDDITKVVHKRDPLATYTMSTPWDAYSKCTDYTKDVTELLPNSVPNFKAMFVFDGCGFIPRPEVDTAAPTPPGDLLNLFANGAQNIANGGQVAADAVPDAIRKKVCSRFSITEELEGFIVRNIREKVRDTVRAPYLAWSQISALFAPTEQRASEVFGSLELLAFPGVQRVITNIDSTKGTFDFVSKQDFFTAAKAIKAGLTDLDVARAVLLLSRNRQFSIRCLHNETLESLLGRFPFKDVIEKQADPGRRDLMQRNVAALDAPVMTAAATVQYLSRLYNLEKTSSVGAAFGTQAPWIFYYFLLAGPVMPKPFATFSQKRFADDWPLVDSTAYRKVAENILPLRVQVAFQLFQAVAARMPQDVMVDRDIVWLRQYARFGGQNSQMADRRISPIIRPPEIHLTYWRVTDADLSPDGQPADRIYFSSIIPLSERSTPEQPQYNTLAPTLATVLLRSLDLLGYFTHSTEGNETSGPSIYTQALDQFSCPTLSEYGVLLIELVRTYTLNDEPIQTMLMPNDPERQNIGVRFAARLLSIIPLNVEGVWTGPFDVEMAAFGMNTRLLSSTLRHLTEVIASLMFYTEATSLPVDELDTVIARLPFDWPTEFNAGFLMQWILMNIHPNMTIDDVKNTFPQFCNLDEDLDVLFWFWSMAFRALEIIRREEDSLIDYDVLMAAHHRVCDACRIIRPRCYDQYLAVLQSPPPPPVQYYDNYGRPTMGNYNMPHYNNYGPQ